MLSCAPDARKDAAPPPQADSAIVLSGATLIDGAGGAPKPSSEVIVQGDRIMAVGEAGHLTRPEGARVIDLTGRYLVPGFIDMHAHVTILHGSMDDKGYDSAASEQVLRTMLAFGITTTRNPAAPTGAGVSLRASVAAGRIMGPRIITCGEALSTVPVAWAPTSVVHDEAGLREEIRRQAAAGVDCVKFYIEMPPALLKAGILQAHEQGLHTVGHIEATSWTEAAEDGIDTLEHAWPTSAALLPEKARAAYKRVEGLKSLIAWLEAVDLDGPEISQMIWTIAHAGVAVDPTLVAREVKFWGDDPAHLNNPLLWLVPEAARYTGGAFPQGWDAGDYRRAKAAWPKAQRLTRMLHEAGVVLLAGSDIPNPLTIPGESLHEEMALLVQAGIPPLDVIGFATHNGAESLGLLSSIGTIEAGKTVDMVVLSADPIADIRNTRRIETVISRGRLLSPESLLPAKGR